MCLEVLYRAGTAKRCVLLVHEEQGQGFEHLHYLYEAKQRSVTNISGCAYTTYTALSR